MPHETDALTRTDPGTPCGELMRRYSPVSQPLALLQLQYVLAGHSEPSSVVGVIVVLLTVGVAIAARAIGFRVGLARATV